MSRTQLSGVPAEPDLSLQDRSRAQVMGALFWSFVQGWGTRVLTLATFLILARLLSHEALGLAATVALILYLLNLLAEFGYGDAMVQRASLEPRDVTLPFATSIAISLTLAVGLVVFAPRIELLMSAPGLARLLPVAALTLPLMTLSLVQEALYRRALDYRSLALRMLTATVLSSVVGIGGAFLGLGALSLVLQTLVLVAISTAWLWWRPKWTPRREGDRASWTQLSRYSASVLANRLVDFGTTRTIEIIILSLYGPAGLGLYAVGSRVYQTAIQVLATTVSDVSLSTISRFADDRARVRATYLRTILLSSLAASPLFVGAAALAPELTTILFGTRWLSSAEVMTPLMLLGAIQTVQFINGAYFSALGRPVFTMSLNILKAAVVVPALLLVPTEDIGVLTIVFALGQLVVTPFSFLIVTRLTDVRLREILRILAPAVLCSTLSFLAVVFLRAELIGMGWSPVPRFLGLGVAFVALYLAGAALLSRHTLMALLSSVLTKLKKRSSGF